MSAAVNRLWENRWAIVTLAVVTCAFVVVGELSPLLGIIGFVVVCAAMVVAKPPVSFSDPNASSQAAPLRAGLPVLGTPVP